MASRYEVEVRLCFAKDLKNVNWRHGPLRPYAVLWVDPRQKCSTRVDEAGDTSPNWEETVVIPLPGPVNDDSTLCIDIVHAGSESDVKPLVGSSRLHLRDVYEDVGLGERSTRTLKLKRPSGRPHGKLEVEVLIKDPYRRAPDAYYAPSYGVPPPASRDYPAAPRDYPSAPRDYPAAPPAYGAQPRDPYYAAAPPSGYAYSGYDAKPTYGQQSYGQAPYGGQAYGQPEEKKKSKFGGMGTGLALGAVAGVVGGIALTEGFEHLEDKIEDNVADRVEDDEGFDGDDGGFDGDDY